MSDFVWPVVRVDADLNRGRVEWLHTNGAGAYASSTVVRMHTRRYHGLLVAALTPPRQRHVILSHVDATVNHEGSSFALATHQFPSVPPTAGHRFLSRFSQDPLPRWVYNIQGNEFEHTLAMVRGENAVVLRYVWNGHNPVSLELRPLLALRPFHDLVHEHGAMIQRVEMRQNEVRVRPVEALPRVAFRHNGIFVGSPDWWRRFEYLDERARGLEFQEDLWTPGVFRFTLQPGVPIHLACGMYAIPERPSEELMQETAQSLIACDPGANRAWSVRSLSVAADLFRADKAPMPGVIAGYPWFELWGRHTLGALPGLYFVPGRVDDAKRVVTTLLQHTKDGLIPNRLPDDGRPAEYHAVDATLLLFQAAQHFAQALGPKDEFVSSTLVPALADIFETLCKGTVDGIHVTADGLLAAGTRGTSLTWMDARVRNEPVTSRAGLAVELQAMWAKGCQTLGWLAREAGRDLLSERAQSAATRAHQAFVERFWCQATSYPYDVVSQVREGPGSWVDSSIRPNALLALSTCPSLFQQWQKQAIIERVERELLTSAGIRTLSPFDPMYRGSYAGGIAERDSAYHQGTVWPFLLGAYVHAACETFPDDADRKSRLRARVEGVLSNTVALGCVPEIADGEPPHRPNGCVAQASSVAELLRTLVQDLGL